MLPLDLFIGCIGSSLRRLSRGKHPQFPTCMKMQGWGIALGIEWKCREREHLKSNKKISKYCWKHCRVFMDRLEVKKKKNKKCKIH